jgi:hypothetical protein
VVPLRAGEGKALEEASCLGGVVVRYRRLEVLAHRRRLR